MVVLLHWPPQRSACCFQRRLAIPGPVKFRKRRARLKALVRICYRCKKRGHVLFKALAALREQQGGNRRGVALVSSIAEELVPKRRHAVRREIQDQFDEVQIEIIVVAAALLDSTLQITVRQRQQIPPGGSRLTLADQVLH